MARDREACANCNVAFAADLTAGECPVCGTAVFGHVARIPLDADQRIVAVVAAAMAANFLLLAWLAVLYLGS